MSYITHDPKVMGGRPCIRGMRVTVGMVLGLMCAGHSEAEILDAYPYLTAEDLRAALEYGSDCDDPELRSTAETARLLGNPVMRKRLLGAIHSQETVPFEEVMRVFGSELEDEAMDDLDDEAWMKTRRTV